MSPCLLNDNAADESLIPHLEATLIVESEYNKPVYNAVTGEPLTFSMLNTKPTGEVTMYMNSIFSGDGNSTNMQALFRARH